MMEDYDELKTKYISEPTHSTNKPTAAKITSIIIFYI